MDSDETNLDTVQILRAQGVGDAEPATTTINIHDQIDAHLSAFELRRLFERQGRDLAFALCRSLPGGTIDALLIELMRRRASLFVVPLTRRD